MPRDAARDQELRVDQQGFSLHVAVRCDADERQRLEQLCRYITRPALANERVQIPPPHLDQGDISTLG